MSQYYIPVTVKYLSKWLGRRNLCDHNLNHLILQQTEPGVSNQVVTEDFNLIKKNTF